MNTSVYQLVTTQKKYPHGHCSLSRVVENASNFHTKDKTLQVLYPWYSVFLGKSLANGDVSRESGWCKCVSVTLFTLPVLLLAAGNVDVASENNELNEIVSTAAVELPLRQMRLKGEANAYDDADESDNSSSSSHPSSLPMGFAWHSNGALQIRLVMSSSASNSQRRLVPLDARKIDMAEDRLRG